MKYLVFILFFILASCDHREFPSNLPPLQKLPPSVQHNSVDYEIVAQAFFTIKNNRLDNNNMMASPISKINVSYCSKEIGKISIDSSKIQPTESGDVLKIGTISISDLVVNKLKVCGVTHKEQCKHAVIRVYTEELEGFENIEGFVNVSDGYGVPLYIQNGQGKYIVKLKEENSVVVQDHVIPPTQHKVKLSDFPNATYTLTSDFSNAGFGSYEVSVVVELSLSL